MNAFSTFSVNDFCDACMVNSMFPLIHIPPRITQSICTLLDNIFTNDLENIFSGVLIADISDHFPIFSICYNYHKDRNDSFNIKRNLSEANMTNFIDKISNISWVLNNDPNHSYDCFLKVHH
mgnify:FL=1